MKYLISLVIFTCLSLQFGFSQVKKSYIDSDYSQTTVVVKEDNASDIDILNSQFDINSVGLGEVIMIKTEKEPKKVKEALPEVAEKPAPRRVVKEATKPAREVAALPKARKKVSEKYFKGSGKSKKVKKKRKRRRFKNKKFKKKKRRTGCPTF